MAVMVIDEWVKESRLEHALEILPKGVNLENEDEFVQAGALLVEHIRTCTIALGELLDWKMRKEMAVTDDSRDRIFGRYAQAWGTSHTSLVRAWVLVNKHRDVDRPQDLGPTAQYEVLSGSDTPDVAEAGFNTVTQEGYGVEKIREAKMLQAAGLSDPNDWEVPYLFIRGDDIWARTSDGDTVRVWQRDNKDDALANKAATVSKRRLHI